MSEIRQRTRPFLKWAGGKTQLLADLVRHVPESYNRYIEPFVGGGALFFHLRPLCAILSDSNAELINCYTVVRDHVYDLIEALNHYHNEEGFYYEIRAQNPVELDKIRRAARLVFLNHTCFNGLYRVNKKGQFNVPFGKYKNPTICDESALLAAHHALQCAELLHNDYSDTLHQFAGRGDFIFLDPPYYPVGGHADFKRYTQKFFYEADHIVLRDTFRRYAQRGCHMLLTNSNVPFVKELYADFEQIVVDTKRNISSDAGTRTGQDLIVIATANPSDESRLPLIENFPGTKYMGSKYKMLPFIWRRVEHLDFESVLDAFTGSTSVSYMFKENGKRVIANDFLHFSYHTAKALIENAEIKLDENDINLLFAHQNLPNHFISDTFRGLYFNDEDNAFLDGVRANIELLQHPLKRSLALAALTRACMKRRARGIFTFTGYRYDDGRKDLQMSLREHFAHNIIAFNRAVFDNGQRNLAFNRDVFDLDIQADLVYLDPPYLTPNSDNDYTRRYHFVEGLVRNWEGVEIQQHTATKKIRSYASAFSSKNTIITAFDRLFRQFRQSIIVLSYSSNSIPDRDTLVGMLEQYKAQVEVYEMTLTYSFGNQGHIAENESNRVQEYLFVAR
jgi:DNA adenine methylase